MHPWAAPWADPLYDAAALERMAESDFTALHTARQDVPQWPVTYAEFTPFYEAAERLYGALAQPEQTVLPRLSQWDREFLQLMRHNGMQPELLHVAIRYDEACQECIGQVCLRSCKSDARTACLDKAMADPAFLLLEDCEVLSLEADETRVNAVIARHKGREIRLQARAFVLAAGALHTPQLLLRSANTYWPDGLANRSGQVGRNLMFHTGEVYAVWARDKLVRAGRQRKALSIRDFYQLKGRRLGYVQSMGLDADYWAIAAYLKNLLRRYGLRNERLLNALVPLPSRLAARVLGTAVLFGAMSEDDPDPENRLVLDENEPDGASFRYTITDDLRERANALYAAFAKGIAPWRVKRISPALEMNYGHPCGTCRFGDDPAHNVLDRDCKAHGLDNLYVCDASFMPRSGAVNPSLTIAANALRVAQILAQRVSGAALARQ